MLDNLITLMPIIVSCRVTTGSAEQFWSQDR